MSINIVKPMRSTRFILFPCMWRYDGCFSFVVRSRPTFDWASKADRSSRLSKDYGPWFLKFRFDSWTGRWPTSRLRGAEVPVDPDGNVRARHPGAVGCDWALGRAAPARPGGWLRGGPGVEADLTQEKGWHSFQTEGDSLHSVWSSSQTIWRGVYKWNCSGEQNHPDMLSPRESVGFLHLQSMFLLRTKLIQLWFWLCSSCWGIRWKRSWFRSLNPRWPSCRLWRNTAPWRQWCLVVGVERNPSWISQKVPSAFPALAQLPFRGQRCNFLFNVSVALHGFHFGAVIIALTLLSSPRQPHPLPRPAPASSQSWPSSNHGCSMLLHLITIILLTIVLIIVFVFCLSLNV